MSKELVEDKDVKNVANVEEIVDDQVLNVFVHSKSGLADAWTEAEVDALLSAWRHLLEQSGPVELPQEALVRRVLKRLKEGAGGFPRLDKLETKKEAHDDILRQMDALRNEYQVFKGMQTIEGLLVYRHPCVDQLESILDRVPQTRKTAAAAILQGDSGGAAATSENSDDPPPSKRLPVSKSNTSQQRAPRSTSNRNQDEVKPRFQQRRVNLTRLVRVMVSKQQTMLEQLERLFQVLEQSSEVMGKLEKVFVHSATEKTATEVDAEVTG